MSMCLLNWLFDIFLLIGWLEWRCLKCLQMPGIILCQLRLNIDQTFYRSAWVHSSQTNPLWSVTSVALIKMAIKYTWLNSMCNSPGTDIVTYILETEVEKAPQILLNKWLTNYGCKPDNEMLLTCPCSQHLWQIHAGNAMHFKLLINGALRCVMF